MNCLQKRNSLVPRSFEEIEPVEKAEPSGEDLNQDMFTGNAQ